MSWLKAPATIIAVLGLLVVGGMLRPLFVYPKRVRTLTAADGTRVDVLITHEVGAVECLTLGLAPRLYDDYGLTVRLVTPAGQEETVEASVAVLDSEREAWPDLIDLKENGHLSLVTPAFSATVDVKTGRIVGEP